MIEGLFQGLQDGSPLHWSGLILAFYFLFKFIKSMGKIMLLLLILGASIYSIYYYNPELINSFIDSILERTSE